MVNKGETLHDANRRVLNKRCRIEGCENLPSFMSVRMSVYCEMCKKKKKKKLQMRR